MEIVDDVGPSNVRKVFETKLSRLETKVLRDEKALQGTKSKMGELRVLINALLPEEL